LIFLSLLALPVIGQIVAVYLISKLILSAKGIFEVKKDKLLLPAF
jgi:Na+-transporting NADH:ubiquinone oxidoreductase subunit NqrB